MDENAILIERHEGYRVITLNRPQRLNAFTEPMHRMLREALTAAEADATCRALLLTGAGRGFCTGQDLNDRLSKAGETPVLGGALEAYYNPLVRQLRSLPFPVVAAVNGVAAGAGCNVALACDIVLAGKSASFIQSFARIGLVPDSGGTWILPRLVGPARARGLALLAEPLPAETAADWGLIWKALPDEALMDEAHKLCRHFAAAPTLGLALTKRGSTQPGTTTLKLNWSSSASFSARRASIPTTPKACAPSWRSVRPSLPGGGRGRRTRAIEHLCAAVRRVAGSGSRTRLFSGPRLAIIAPLQKRKSNTVEGVRWLRSIG